MEGRFWMLTSESLTNATADKEATPVFQGGQQRLNTGFFIPIGNGGSPTMLEYIFFDEQPWRQFLEFLENLDLNPNSTLSEGTWLVELPEDIEDELFERIEAFYDQMLDYNEELVIAAEGDAHIHTAGVNITLADGRTVQAAVDPKLMRCLLEAVTPEELGRFVDRIVEAVESPPEMGLCQR
jgi:hypothetical protein